MKRKKVVRVELILLGVVTLLLAYRAIEGPPEPQGAVVMSDLDVERVHHQAFAVDRPTRVTIEAVGSFESSDERGSSLAAFGWLLDRMGRNVVWMMDSSSVVRDRGGLATVSDTVVLNAGTYDAYFSSYGNRDGYRFGISFLDRLIGTESAWRGDQDHWKLIIRQVEGEQAEIKRLGEEEAAELAPKRDDLLWTTAPMGGGRSAEYVFQVADDAKLAVYAIGEIDNRQMDFGWIENVVTGERIWEMTFDNTVPAGGWRVNRKFHDTLAVSGGVYRATYKTDARQNWGDWAGNPPLDPAAWGITLSATPSSAVSSFDPLTSRQPIIELTRVGNDQRRQAQFKVNEPVQLAAYAIGEIRHSSRYDWGWLRSNDTQESIWEMSHERSRMSGEDESIRSELAFFRLEPGTYTLGYETDDSHAYDTWIHGQPEHPDRYGVSLFPMAERIDSTTIDVLDMQTMSLNGEKAEAPAPPPHPEHPAHVPSLPGSMMVSLAGIGNEERAKASFTLEESSKLHVRAVGEISISGRYDYGWIERADSGEIVWEMTLQNTSLAGGADRNRRFDGVIELPAGEYIVHFKTDFSHAHGDFGDEAPSDPEGWGVRISKL